MSKLEIFTWQMTTGIKASPEFSRKGLAEFSINPGVKCSHGCTYRSSGAVNRCHRAFKVLGRSPYATGFGIVDPDCPTRVAHDAARLGHRGLAQLSTTVDAWCPAAQKYDLGRRCLDAVLREPGWSVRILTKSAAVDKDLDVVEAHRRRVLVGLSLTATPRKSHLLRVVEPEASSSEQRMAIMQMAHKRGMRTYGMLCPLLPGIGDAQDEIEDLVEFLADCGVEEIFAEAVNARGPGLKSTEEALRQARFCTEADAVARIRTRSVWSAYAADLLAKIQAAMRKRRIINRLRYLLYADNLDAEDLARIQADPVGVVWL